MDRRAFIAALAGVPLALTMAPVLAQPAPAQPAMRTRWVVRGSEGFDALSFLGPLSGDSFYLGYYRDAVAAFAPRMPTEAMQVLRGLMAQARQFNQLLSPFLDLRFSSGPHDSIDDLIMSLDNAETVLRPPFEASPYWGTGESWGTFLAARPHLRTVLVALRDAGFAAFRAELFDRKAATRFPALRERLARIDVIGEVEHFTGRTLDPTVEIILLEFCRPHGIKVIGQRFLSAIDWPDQVHIRTAGHELLHPPIDMSGSAAREALAIIGRDELIARVLREHDPRFGYNRLEGLFDEDLASALDQLIAERLGFARDARERWNDVDGGMHILSAAFYGLMRETGFAATGGNVERWLANTVASGRLAPASLHAAAALVLGRPADRLWPVPASS
jgi:hypothetical protein